MRALVVVFLHPPFEIGLQLSQRPIDLLSKRDPIKFIEHGFVEALADPIGLGMPRLGPGVIDVLYGQIQFVLMAFGGATVLGPAVGQYAVHRNLLLLEEGQHPIIQEIGSHHRSFAIIQFRKPDLTIGVDERLLIDAPDALERAHIEGVLGPRSNPDTHFRIRRGLLCPLSPSLKPRPELPSGPSLPGRPWLPAS